MNRDLDWDNCVNVRDLGGLPTEDGCDTTFGVVVRADNVHRLTERGWREARQYGITTVLDLRSDSETAANRPLDRGVVQRHVSLFEHFDGDPAYRIHLEARVATLSVRDQYRTLYLEALDRDAPQFAEALRVVSTAPAGTLIHCERGKDRTGVFAALLLRLVGVPIAVVETDYVRSEARLGVADSAPSDVIGRVIEAIEARHGSTAEYFMAAGAQPTEIDRVAKRLLG